MHVQLLHAVMDCTACSKIKPAVTARLLSVVRHSLPASLMPACGELLALLYHTQLPE
jgi:hypothetical protein